MDKSTAKNMLRVSRDKIFKKEDYIRTLIRQSDWVITRENTEGATASSMNKRKSLLKRIQKNSRELENLKKKHQTLRNRLIGR